MARELKDIVIGDRVWVSAPYSGDRGDLHVVEHLTPTQVHLNGYKQKFKRGTPSKWSGNPDWSGIGFTRGTILSIATPEEIAAWDADIEKQKAAMDARKQAETDAAAKRQELTALFPVSEDENRGTSVRDADYGNREDRGGRYSVTFHNLTEAEVRALAAKNS